MRNIEFTCICKVCSNKFTSDHPGRKFCSEDCKSKYKSSKNLCKCGCGALCKNEYVHGHNPKNYEEVAKKVSKWRKEKFERDGWLNSPEARKNIGLAQIGRIPWNKDKTKETDSRLMKTSEAIKETYREGTNKGLLPETIAKRRASLKKTLRDHPEIVQKACSSDTTKPNSFEQKLIKIIEENRLPFRWVGNGKFWLTYNGINCNPDFIADKPMNLLIEVFSNHFKIKNYGSVKNYLRARKQVFNHHGYKVVFFNDNQINNGEKILYKLNRYMKSSAAEIIM